MAEVIVGDRGAAKGGGQAKQESGQQRGSHRKGQDGGIDADSVGGKRRELAGHQRPQETEAHDRQGQTDDGTRQRKECGLGQHGGQELTATRPEGRPDRKVAATRLTSCQDQAGHVGAGDQQHEPDGAHQDEHRRPGLANGAVDQRM